MTIPDRLRTRTRNQVHKLPGQRKVVDTEQDVLNVTEAAELLRVSKTMVYELVRGDSGIPVRRVGKKKLRFSRRALLEWLAGAT